jgi:O-antigen/teichoic acid export membrane protein
VGSGRWEPRSAFVQTQLAAVALGLAGAALAVVARIAAPGAFGGLSVGLVALAVAGLPFFVSSQYSRWLAVAADRYEVFVLPLWLVSSLTLVLAGSFAAAWGTSGTIAGLFAAQVLTGTITLVVTLRGLPPATGPSPPGRLREAAAFGVRANAAAALQLVNYRLDLFVLSAVASASRLGLYAAAVSVTSIMFLAPQTLAQVVFPRVAALSAADTGRHAEREMVEAKSLRHVSLVTLVSLPVVALAMVVLVPLIYGGRFSGAVALGLVLLPGVALFGIAAVMAATTNGRGHPEYSLRGAALSTPPTLVLYGVLIPLFGAWGAAVASTVSYAINFAVTAVYYRRATGERVLPLMVPTRDELADLRSLVRRAA